MVLLDEAKSLFEYTQSLRRDFHRFPELGFQEVRTSGVIAGELNRLGLQVRSGIAETGVVALIEGKKARPVVLLRFDMDALPIHEESKAEYASRHPGVMHACGHDGHIAVGLTVARLLHAHRDELAGTVKLIFQPAEEGEGGAERMVAEGVLENPKPDIALAIHVWNEKPLGWLGITPGAVMSAADIFRVQIVGKGGHGAQPHLTNDPLLASSHIVTALQSIVSRNVPPLHTAVVSTCMIHGGDAFNVIPGRVELQGTIRAFDPTVHQLVRARLHQIVEGTAQLYGCTAEIEVKSLTTAVINDAQITKRLQEIAAKLLPDSQIDTEHRSMVSEDMSVILDRVPGCFIFVGSANAEKGLNAAHHHPRFDFDEQALARASALMAGAVLELLR